MKKLSPVSIKTRLIIFTVYRIEMGLMFNWERESGRPEFTEEYELNLFF